MGNMGRQRLGDGNAGDVPTMTMPGTTLEEQSEKGQKLMK
jgi:hypothetical protein